MENKISSPSRSIIENSPNKSNITQSTSFAEKNLDILFLTLDQTITEVMISFSIPYTNK